jgi:light-regulated signal transduction histidine kinase (bacteriophytochrome)
LVSGAVSDASAVNIIKEGASDYILKDRMERLPVAITQAIEKEKNRHEKVQAADEKAKIISELLRRNKELEQFTYIISHHLRSPVANIMGLAQALTEDNYPEALRKEFLTQLNLSVLKMDDVIRDINKSLQIKNNINELKEVVCFTDVVKDIKTSIAHFIEMHKVIIETDFDEVDKFMTVKSYVYSLLNTLISNSIKYRQPGLLPVISLKSLRINDGIQLIISDNGLGINLDKNSNSIFGLYKRFHPHIEGKGIGLFLAKTEIEKLGGAIEIKSKVNYGTTFKIFLPSTNF